MKARTATSTSPSRSSGMCRCRCPWRDPLRRVRVVGPVGRGAVLWRLVRTNINFVIVLKRKTKHHKWTFSKGFGISRNINRCKFGTWISWSAQEQRSIGEALHCQVNVIETLEKVIDVPVVKQIEVPQAVGEAPDRLWGTPSFALGDQKDNHHVRGPSVPTEVRSKLPCLIWEGQERLRAFLQKVTGPSPIDRCERC